MGHSPFSRNAFRITGLLVAILLLISATEAQRLVKASSSTVTMKLNQRFYSNGDLISATVKNGVIAPMYQQFIVFVSPKTGDAEGLKLKNGSASELITEGQLKISVGGTVGKNDGMLTTQAGEVITAYYYLTDIKGEKPAANKNKKDADVVCEFAFIRGNENYLSRFQINKKYALDPSEDATNAISLLVEGQLPVQVAKNQAIFYSNSGQQWKEFQEYSQCKLLGSIPSGKNTGGDAYLVEIPVKDQNISDLGQLRTFLGYNQKVFCSNEEGLKLVQFCALANLNGYTLSLNPRMQFYGTNKGSDKWIGEYANPPGTGESIPPSFTDVRTNIPKVWNYMAVWDRDVVPINVAVLDFGFAPTPDFRNSATMVQCEVSPLTGIRCAPGTALGIPTVGASLFGGRVWHGTGVQARAAAVLNNNFGTAGTGGQVAVPMILKMSGSEAYAFSIAGAIRSAVDNGAHVINLSGGFPCRALTSLGDFSYCDPAVRGAICAALFPIVEAGAVIACSALGWIPFAGPFLVGGCIATATSAYITACIAQFAIGNPGEIMSGAVQYAKSRGVPVVVSAGNMMDESDLSGVPAELRPFINLDPNRMTVEDWEIVPAGLPDVICVGATQPSGSYLNTQFFGRRVDIWAPEDGFYMAPESGERPAGPGNPIVLKTDFNASSSAAPFIAGLVADAMALNPQLNRNVSSNITGIVPAIRNMLSTSAWSAAELPADATARRRNLINPIRFIKAAGFADGSPVPNVSDGIYGNNWNIEATESLDDVTPTAITYSTAGSLHNGTIIRIPGADGAPAIVDVDRFRLNVPSSYRPVSGETVILKLRTPTGSRFGNLTIRGTGITFSRREVVSAAEEELIFQGAAVRPGTSIDFSVEGATPDQDNLYLLRVGNISLPPATITRTVNLTDITTELCPTTLERGDREFGGGPRINIVANLVVTADGSGLDVVISYRAEEMGGDRTTATGSFRQRVFNASAGTRIVSVVATTATSAVTNFMGAGAGAEFGICNEGVVQEPPVTGGLIRRIVVVGDSGGNDVSAGGGCRCDTKIKSVQFNQVLINTAPR
ncbi:MAG: S8 family serine peptidase [Bacteroidetes bacterium]|nr:S8 family serine peptidase [Bacteroidota bacterium]